MATLVAAQLDATSTPNAADSAYEENPHSVEVTQPVQIVEAPTFQVAQDIPIPEEYYIYSIWGHRQYFPIGCEASAVTDWARFFGWEINEFNFQYQLPQSDNPDLGFVGSVEGPWGQVPPYSYGVHAAPVAKVLVEEYDIQARAVKGFSLEELKKEIAAERPVIVWVIGNCVGGVPHEYIDREGNTTIVAPYQHVVIVTGYAQDTIRYMNNGKFYDIPNDYFLRSWGVLGNMALILDTSR